MIAIPTSGSRIGTPTQTPATPISTASAALQPVGVPLADSVQAAYFRAVTRAFDLQEHAALLLAGTRETVGLPYAAVQRISRSADLGSQALLMMPNTATKRAVLRRIRQVQARIADAVARAYRRVVLVCAIGGNHHNPIIETAGEPLSSTFPI